VQETQYWLQSTAFEAAYEVKQTHQTHTAQKNPIARCIARYKIQPSHTRDTSIYAAYSLSKKACTMLGESIQTQDAKVSRTSARRIPFCIKRCVPSRAWKPHEYRCNGKELTSSLQRIPNIYIVKEISKASHQIPQSLPRPDQ
jgi:hypothetical protein